MLLTNFITICKFSVFIYFVHLSHRISNIHHSLVCTKLLLVLATRLLLMSSPANRLLSSFVSISLLSSPKLTNINWQKSNIKYGGLYYWACDSLYVFLFAIIQKTRAVKQRIPNILTTDDKLKPILCQVYKKHSSYTGLC